MERKFTSLRCSFCLSTPCEHFEDFSPSELESARCGVCLLLLPVRFLLLVCGVEGSPGEGREVQLAIETVSEYLELLPPEVFEWKGRH